MTTDRSAAIRNKGYAVSQATGVLNIVIARDIGDIGASRSWAQGIIDTAVGPFRRLEFDVTGLHRLASTTIAGVIQLIDHYRRHGTVEFHLLGANDRTRRTLEMMKIDGLLEFR